VLLAGSVHLATGELEYAQGAYTFYLDRHPGHVYARKMLAATFLRKAQPQSAVHTLAPLLQKVTDDAELLALGGQAYTELGRLDVARKLLERAAAIDPDNARTRARLGVANLVSGDRRSAVSELEVAAALDPTDGRAENYLVMALIGQNDTAKALQHAEALVKRRPDQPASHLLKGAVYLARQETPLARQSFEQALKLKPGFFPAAAALARLDLQEKKPDDARRRMEGVLKHDKNNLDATLALAKFEYDAGRLESAMVLVRRAQIDHPGASAPALMLAQLQLNSGNPKEALEAARKARDLARTDPRAWDVLGRAELAAGNINGAIESFTTLSGLAPRSTAAQMMLAQALAEDGDHRRAIATFRKLLSADPGNSTARIALGNAYIRGQRYAEALELATGMQKQGLAAGHILEGDVLRAQQHHVRALAAYRRADQIQTSGALRIRIHEMELMAKGEASDAALVEWVKRNPDDIEVRLYLADAYSRNRQYDAAVQHYEALLQRNPREVRVLNNLAWALGQRGDSRALDYAHMAFQIEPGNAAVTDTLGWLLVSRGKVHEGLQLMLKAASLDPTNSEIRFRLAQALVKVGDYERARNELRALLSTDPKFPQASEVQALLKRLPS
jgi:putative PEP-CTERM system TPR-repeat lipoprotein